MVTFTGAAQCQRSNSQLLWKLLPTENLPEHRCWRPTTAGCHGVLMATSAPGALSPNCSSPWSLWGIQCTGQRHAGTTPPGPDPGHWPLALCLPHQPSWPSSCAHLLSLLHHSVCHVICRSIQIFVTTAPWYQGAFGLHRATAQGAPVRRVFSGAHWPCTPHPYPACVRVARLASC